MIHLVFFFFVTSNIRKVWSVYVFSFPKGILYGSIIFVK